MNQPEVVKEEIKKDVFPKTDPEVLAKRKMDAQVQRVAMETEMIDRRIQMAQSRIDQINNRNGHELKRLNDEITVHTERKKEIEAKLEPEALEKLNILKERKAKNDVASKIRVNPLNRAGRLIK
jgi:hypothetical protein